MHTLLCVNNWEDTSLIAFHRLTLKHFIVNVLEPSEMKSLNIDDIWNFFKANESTTKVIKMIQNYLPTLVGLRPSFILMGCAKIWYFLPAFKNNAVLCRDGFDNVGTPKLWYWPLIIFATAGSSVFEKSLKNKKIIAYKSSWIFVQAIYRR